ATTTRHADAATVGAAKAPDPLGDELRRARQAMARAAFTEADAALARAEALTGGALEKRVEVAYYRATLALYRGDAASSAALLAANIDELSKHPELDLEFWAHNELTWVRWMAGDLAGALVET